MSKKLSDKDIKKILFDKYKSFEITNARLEKIYLDAVCYSVEYDQKKKFFCREVEKYIVDELKKDNIDMQIKVIDQYKSIITIARQKYTTMSVKEISNIYEQAIEYLKYMYNEEETLSMNIVNNFKYIISNNVIGKSIESKDVKLFDITFLEQYIKYFTEATKKYYELLDCSPEYFNKLIKGEERATKDNIDSLCIEFDVNNYDELVELVKEKVKKKKLEIMMAKTKPKEKPKQVKKETKPVKTYDLRFMKLYLSKNNVSKETFSKFINIDISKVDNVLDGTYKLPEDKLKRLYELFNVKTYDELKIAVGKVIVAKKEKEELQKKKLIEQHKQNQTKQEPKQEELKRDLSFLKEYIKLSGYPKRNLINVLHCGEGALDRILDGDLLVKESLLWELYSEFHTRNYEELKELTTKKIEKKKIDNLIVNFSKIDLFRILNIDLNIEKDKFILILLFGGINNKSYTAEEVSKMLDIDKNYVDDLYKKTLIKIKEEIENSKNKKLTK